MMRGSLVCAVVGVFLFPSIAATPQPCQLQQVFAVAVHGGEFSHKVEGPGRLAAMKAALEQARASLKGGARSVDVVEDIVRGFEDSGLFNTGRGAIANAAGQVETDAAIMDGDGLRSGAVASMTLVRNPIHAARLVMDANRHVLIVGDRGQAYVEKLGAETVPESYFANTGKVTRQPQEMPKSEHGTVGAVALDRCGHLAAATSTGGFDAKAPGRVGDSPLVGDGVYAADGVAAFSGTGFGEFFIRFNIAKDASDRMRYAKQPLARAMRAVLFDVLKPLNAEGGLIGIDGKGNVAMQFNALGMFRGYATDSEAPVVAQYDGQTASKPRKGK
jgi:beta-aspartyl-peptidase (threonine type)